MMAFNLSVMLISFPRSETKQHVWTLQSSAILRGWAPQRHPKLDQWDWQLFPLLKLNRYWAIKVHGLAKASGARETPVRVRNALEDMGLPAVEGTLTTSCGMYVALLETISKQHVMNSKSKFAPWWTKVVPCLKVPTWSWTDPCCIIGGGQAAHDIPAIQ